MPSDSDRDRSLKRTSDALESQADDGNGNDSPSASNSGSKVKLPRLDRGPEDFSSVVKSKLQSYTRTGQACDRCKVRKIRCDALPEGCSHCTNQSLACYVTDRVTGRTERRGYLQELEREKNDMLAHIREMEKLLENNGVEVRPWQWSAFGPPGGYQPSPSAAAAVFDPMGNPTTNNSTSNDQWNQIGSLWVKKYQQKPQDMSAGYSLPTALEPRPADGHLGVVTDSAPLSSINGTQLSILGTTIDITSFDAPDMDEPPPGAQITSPLYNKSVQAFLNSTMRVNPPLDHIGLPSREDAFTYSEWYFLMIYPFIPLLHKPSYMKLLGRIYDDPSFEPSTAELVIVHMVFATIYFQYGVRNHEDHARREQLNELSNKHYHWCLNKFYDLASVMTLTAVQALAMIACHTRSFPKPGSGSLVAVFVFNKAIEMNLHRAMKRANEATNLENEMRKRTWWGILTVVVTLNGRLGRPMPISLDEFDAELPLAIPDEALTETGITDPTSIGQCTYMVGLAAFRIVPLYIEMFSSVYSVRRNSRRYVETVQSLEEQLRMWHEQLPDELKVEKCKPGSQVFALYTQSFSLEFELCLRHPSVCVATDAKVCTENTRMCRETARQLLKVVDGLLRFKSLDTTWYQMSVYVAAIFTMLVADWERRFVITAAEIATLREEMSMWLNVLCGIENLLGSGNRLSNEISHVIDRTVAMIEHDMGRKNGNVSSLQQPHSEMLPNHIKTEPYDPAPSLQPQMPSTQNSNGTTPIDVSAAARSTPAENGAFYDPSIAAATAPYTHLAYTDQGSVPTPNGTTTLQGYDPNDSTQYLYAATAAAAAAAASTAGGAHQAGGNPLVAFASQATQHISGHAGDEWARAMTGQNTWNDWTAAMADSQDRYSANTLLTLGGAQRNDGTTDLGVGADGSVATTSHAGQWPMLIFHDGGGTASGG